MTLDKLQILATNKAESRCYEISNATDRDYSKKVNTSTFSEHFYLRVRLEKIRLVLIHYARR